MLLPSSTKAVFIYLLLVTLHSFHSASWCQGTTQHVHNRKSRNLEWFWKRGGSSDAGCSYNSIQILWVGSEGRGLIAFAPPINIEKKNQRHNHHQRVSFVTLPPRRKSQLFSSTRRDLKYNSSNINDNSREGLSRTRKNNLRNASRIKTVPPSSSPPPLHPSLRSENYHNESKKSNMKIPNHVAFICDGNSRWSIQNKNKFIDRDSSNSSERRGKNITFWGHSNGASNVINLIKHIQKNYAHSINYVTMYAFSTENWSRDPDEIEALWNVLEIFSKKFYDYVLQLGIIVKIIGDLDDQRIPLSLRELLRKLETDSSSSIQNDTEKGLTLCIAVNYGGRKDIIDASLKMAELISRGEIIVNSNNGEDASDGNLEKIFSNLLCTSNIPDPDLVIRTGGESRMSNFLIWNCAYSELYFTDTLWPDYGEEELDKAVEWYNGRERRFGGRKGQSEKL